MIGQRRFAHQGWMGGQCAIWCAAARRPGTKCASRESGGNLRQLVCPDHELSKAFIWLSFGEAFFSLLWFVAFLPQSQICRSTRSFTVAGGLPL